jgi:hypothetical protein
MTVRRRRWSLAFLTAGLLLIAATYLWLWPEVRIALADDPVSRIRLGMTPTEVHAIMGRRPDREHDGRPIIEVWNSGGEEFHVTYGSDGRARSMMREDNPIRKASRWVRKLFNR